MNIESSKGISTITPLKSINNNTNAYILKVPYHITVKKSFEKESRELIWINGFGLKFEKDKYVTGFEELGLVSGINDIGNNKFIISFSNENTE